MRFLAVWIVASASLSSFLPTTLKAQKNLDEVLLRGRLTKEERADFSCQRLFMSEEQRMEYLSIRDTASRKAWLERFWKELDPTPTTDRNELYLEMIERKKLASELFGAEGKPGWDSRGEVFIRYGMPGLKTRVWATVSGRKISMPGESWGYSSPDTTINFIDDNLDGRYTVIPWKTEGSDESPWTIRAAGGLFHMEDPQALPAPEQGGSSHSLADLDFDDIGTTEVLKDLVDLVSERYGLEGYWPTGNERSFFLFPGLDLNMRTFFDILAFRGGEGMLRTEIAMEVPVSELALEKSGDYLQSDVELRVLVLDTSLNRVASSEERFTLRSSEDEAATRAKSVLGQTVLTLPPDPYNIWIEAVDLRSGRRGVLKIRKWLVPLDGGLCVSDIQFAKTVVESDEPSRYMKNNLVVIPHPLHLYRIPFPITLYFEIYGLNADHEDHVFYSIEYEIKPVKEGTSRAVEKAKASDIITAGFEMGAFGPNLPVRFQIATENLRPGPHWLKVSIKDRRTREIIEKTARFALVE